MGLRNIEKQNINYTIAPDDDITLTDRLRAIVLARLVDEISGHAPGGAISIEASEAGFMPRVAGDGFVGLTGTLIERLAQLHVTIKAEGYVAFHSTVAISTNPPEIFRATDMGIVALHREPVVIEGRVVVDNGHIRTAQSAIPVQITGLWPVLPPTDATLPAPDPPNLISLQPPLYASRPHSTAGTPINVVRRDVSPISGPGQDKFLLNFATQNQSTLMLSNRQGLNPGDLLMIDALHIDRVEYITIASVVGASTPDQPATVTLTYPLANEHAPDALVRKAIRQTPGPNNALTRDALDGDTCLFLSSMNNLTSLNTLPTLNVVEINGGALTEYHTLSIFSVVSDATGFFRLPPLSRVAQVNIQAQRSGGGPASTLTIAYGPDYSAYENHLDFIFQ